MTQKAKVEISKFVAGLITDASPLTYPENSSLLDVNMELNSDGSRQRALGIDYEANFVQVATGVTSASTLPLGFNTYRWENVGGDPLKIIICVQFGNQVKFFDTDQAVLSSNIIDTHNFDTTTAQQTYSFTAVDGTLVIAIGTNLITTVVYTAGTLSYTTDTIKVRDFFGVQDIVAGIDLTLAQGLQTRPLTLGVPHLYNLRNQSFGIPRMDGTSDTITDPILAFGNKYNTIKGFVKFPSNSDAVTPYLYADSTQTSDRNSKRYFSVDSIKNPLGTARAAQGYFIIDLLNRGASRSAEDGKNRANYPELIYSAAIGLPTDRTPGGATVVGEFAGRVFYGGFSGDVIGGDSKSPKLSSYITFSQLVSNPTQTTLCYQSGDPTSDTDPDIIDTDGGYIRLNDAYGINTMVNLGKRLMVVASNGVWSIYGNNDSGFTATGYVVEKITDKGARGIGSVVQVENTLMYWSDDGIYHLKQNQFGDWISENQTQTKIQKLYNDISVENKKSAIGVYDSYQRKVRWLYGNRLYQLEQQKELVFDINLGAFYERYISQVNGNVVPVAVGGFVTNVFKVNTITDDVLVGVDIVAVSTDTVAVNSIVRSSENGLFETAYVIVTQITPSINFTFGAYTDTSWTDWKSFNGVGVDAPATLITGTASGGDNMRFKQIPYIYVHQKRTEDGFVDDGSGDFTPVHQSSCIIRSMWDWTNSANSNKWGSPFQAYRYNRAYFPADINDDYDTGYQLIVTKNKLRGRGRAISLMFTSEPKKEMHIYGWSLIMSVNDS